jgi:hypothetical protein
MGIVSICGTTSSAFSYGQTLVRKRLCGLFAHLCLIWAKNRPALSPLDIQPSGRMAEGMVSFVCNSPIPQPSWGYGLAQSDTCKLQPMLDIVRQLLQAGLTGADLLQIFVSHRIPLL